MVRPAGPVGPAAVRPIEMRAAVAARALSPSLIAQPPPLCLFGVAARIVAAIYNVAVAATAVRLRLIVGPVAAPEILRRLPPLSRVAALLARRWPVKMAAVVGPVRLSVDDPGIPPLRLAVVAAPHVRGQRPVAQVAVRAV